MSAFKKKSAQDYSRRAYTSTGPSRVINSTTNKSRKLEKLPPRPPLMAQETLAKGSGVKGLQMKTKGGGNNKRGDGKVAMWLDCYKVIRAAVAAAAEGAY